MATRTTSLPTGVVTVLLGDVEGSVRHWEADVPGMSRAMATLAEIVEAAVDRHDGVRPLEQGEGDSFVVAFARPTAALACALEIQRGLAVTSDVLGSPLRVRMAVHAQDARLRDATTYEGALMHRTARLRALAQGGQVFLSGAVQALTAGDLPAGATLVDLGHHRLRDVAEPEHVWQLAHPDLPGPLATPAAFDAGAAALPAQLTAFVGRVMELRAVAKLLQENRLVTLTGPGGVGKTRLAIEVAADAVADHPDGTRFVDLSTVVTPAAVAEAVAASLRLRDEARRTPLERIATSIAADAALLILDNCEQVVGAAASLVDGLLRVCPGLRVIVTSREPLNVGGEAVFPVPRLTLPDGAETFDPVNIAGYDAVRLFADRAHHANPQFEIDEPSLPIVAAICQQVDGLPLAIELAAARLRVMSLATVATSLKEHFRLLDGGPRTSQPRQQSLFASLAWSHDLLDERERALFRRLSVFSGSFTIEAVTAVCAGSPLDPDDVAATFLSLVDKSLVAPAESDRYRLLEMIRQFARDRRNESPDDLDALRERHLEYIIDLAVRSEEGVLGRDATEWLDRLDAEVAIIDDVLAWARETHPNAAVHLASALVNYSFARVNPLSGWRRLEQVLPDDLSALPDDVRAKAQFGSGLLVAACGEVALVIHAPEKLADALAIYERLGDRRGAARVQGIIGVLTAHVAGPAAAREPFEQAVADLRALDDGWWAAFMTGVWGSAHVFLARPSDGLPYLRDAKEQARSNGWPFVARWSEMWEAAGRGMLGEHRQAIAMATECLGAMTTVEDPDNKSFLLGIIGNAHWELGDLEAAERYGAAAAEVGGRHAVGPHEAIGHAIVGRVALVRGDAERARERFERAISIVTASGHQNLVARHACWLADAYTALQRTKEARAAVTLGMEAAAPGAPSIDGVRMLLAAARTEWAAGDGDAAEDRLHEALAMTEQVGGNQHAIAGLELLATIAAAQESDVEAARLCGAADRVRREMERPEGRLSTDAIAARERLGAAAFAAAWDEGRGMTLDEAIAYAARGRGARKRPSSGWASLTPTELEVVRHVADGLSNPQIGERMFISRGTVRTHLSHVFAKLGVTSRAQLAAEAARRG